MSNDPEASTDAVVLAAQSGDAVALEQLVMSVRDRVYRLSLRMTACPADAEDATQEILIRVITRLSTFRGLGISPSSGRVVMTLVGTAFPTLRVGCG